MSSTRCKTVIMTVGKEHIDESIIQFIQYTVSDTNLIIFVQVYIIKPFYHTKTIKLNFCLCALIKKYHAIHLLKRIFFEKDA